jgi:hypothetical protein
MDLQQRRDIIEATNGSIFSCKFLKKDGSERLMNARLKVAKHLRGGVSTTAHKDNLITVFDMQAQNYRNINLITLKSVKWKGEEIFV